MNIHKILDQVDAYFAQDNGPAAEEVIQAGIKEAIQEGDDGALLQLLNEILGYYRESSRIEESFYIAEQAILQAKRMGLEGSIPYATTLLNAANAYRAGGALSQSMECYEAVQQVYEQTLPKEHMLVASLYNNISLLYQEMENFAAAKEALLKALQIVVKHPDAGFEVAVTYANLANTCLQLEALEDAYAYGQLAVDLFTKRGTFDAHHAAALSAVGNYHYKKASFKEAKAFFQRAQDMLEKNLGKTQGYYRLGDYIAACEEKLGQGDSLSGLALCRGYYETYGAPMILAQFPDYADKIAVGLAGEGSDCFGFDDALSADHDYGPGFCMWVDEETFKAIGEKLQAAYEALPQEFLGVRRTETAMGKGRRGVKTISAFYKGYYIEESAAAEQVPKTHRAVGTAGHVVKDQEASMAAAEEARTEINTARLGDGFWETMEDAALSALVNGQVWRDDAGIFSALREKLQAGYPPALQYQKLAQSMSRFSQAGQYNLMRMAKRGDAFTANLLLQRALSEAMYLQHFIENRFPPHEKWLKKSLEMGEEKSRAASRDTSPNKSQVTRQATSGATSQATNQPTLALLGLLEEAARLGAEAYLQQDAAAWEPVLEKIEEIAAFFAKELYAKHFISDTDPYLANHAAELLYKATFADADTWPMEALAEAIAKMEFAAFDKVQNEGGRAECQNNWPTFRIMRMSQYLTWTREMCLQYLYDFERELAKGHNLITEKYGRMMESTAPEKYAQMKAHFPILSREKQAIIEEIASIQVSWMEAFAAEFPALAGNARSIRTKEDSAANTSYETYLRGELGTYSDKMLELYGRYIVAHVQEGKNLAREIMAHNVGLYGYKDLEAAEAFLAG